MSQSETTLASLLLGPSDGSWGDERERGVILEAFAYVYLLISNLLWVTLAIAAWFIPAWVSVALFAVLIIPGIELQRYCKVCGVDVNLLTYGHGSSVRLAVTTGFIVVCAISVAVAVTQSWSDGSSGLTGAVVGGVVGGGIAFFMSKYKARRTQARLDAETEADEIG